jgi:hypothetical protein
MISLFFTIYTVLLIFLVIYWSILAFSSPRSETNPFSKKKIVPNINHELQLDLSIFLLQFRG